MNIREPVIVWAKFTINTLGEVRPCVLRFVVDQPSNVNCVVLGFADFAFTNVETVDRNRAVKIASRWIRFDAEPDLSERT